VAERREIYQLTCCVCLKSLRTYRYCGVVAGLGEVTGVVDGFASGFGVGDGRFAGFVSGLGAGDAPGEGLRSAVEDFFAVAVRWVTRRVGVAPAPRILLPALSKVLPTVLSVALVPWEIALPVA
jgi:hypothetical protein